jgi:hypothetical protein
MGIVSSVICLLHQHRRRQFRKYVPRSLLLAFDIVERFTGAAPKW